MSSSSFKTTTGLPENFEQSIEEFWFGKNPNSEQARDQIYAIVRGAMVDLESGDEEENTLYLSVGKDWEETKGGEAVKNKSGKGQFHRNSAFGKFIDGAVKAGGEELLELLESRGEAYEAETWKGIRFRFERIDSSFQNAEGETITYSTPVPQEYLGEIDDEKPKKAAKKAPAKKAPAKKAPAKKAADDEDDDLRTALVAFAGTFEEDDHDDFIAAVYDEDLFPRAGELEDDEELANAVLDEDDIWAEAH